MRVFGDGDGEIDSVTTRRLIRGAAPRRSVALDLIVVTLLALLCGAFVWWAR